MTKDELRKKIVEKACDKKLSCAAAFAMAEQLDVSVKEIGGLADKLGIKITRCQLGCF